MKYISPDHAEFVYFAENQLKAQEIYCPMYSFRQKQKVYKTHNG